jgi:glycosyltransferase involved in cell wall biosynthesis
VPRKVLQICPHDIAPFGELCRRYAQAAACIDVDMTSVYLAPPRDQALPYAEYLHMQDLADTAKLRQALTRYAGVDWDMVICHRYRSYWAVARSPLADNPSVVLAHEFGLLKRWQRRLARQLFARDFVFAGVSPAVAAELSRVVGQAGVLPNVVDAESDPILLEQAAACAALGLEPGPFTVGVVGRLHYKKRPQLALQAFQRFHQHHPQSRVVFLGGGDQSALGLELLSPAELAHVHVLGNVPAAAQLFKAFDVLLHTASMEPFGMVVLEAMAAGLPVVTQKVGGPEYVLGDLGYYTEDDSPQGFAQALQASLRADHSGLQEAGQQRIQKYFSIAALAQALDHLLIETSAEQG